MFVKNNPQGPFYEGSLLGPVGDCLQILSWNGQAILHSDSHKRSLKKAEVTRLASKAQVLCLQEVHGAQSEIEACLKDWLRGWFIFASAFTDRDGFCKPDTGGCVIAIHPSIADRATFESVTLCPGRCVAVSFRCFEKCFTIVNLHNFGIHVDQFNYINSFLSNLEGEVSVAPESKFGLLVGDFNFKLDGEQIFKVGSPPPAGPVVRGSVPVRSGTLEGKWRGVLNSWVELSQPFPTHFSSQSNSCSRIDRGFIAGPGSLLLRMEVLSHVLGTPESFYAKGLSDHAPLSFSFGAKAKSQGPSVPRFICNHPKFAESLVSICQDVDVLSLPDHQCLPVYKSCIFEAARRTRDFLLFDDSESMEQLRTILASMSRAIWFNNLKLAKTLIAKTHFAALLLEVVEGKVVCKDHVEFTRLFDAVHLKKHQSEARILQQQIQKAPSNNVKKQLKGRLQAARRRQKLFFPKGRKLKLAGIILAQPDCPDLVVSSPSKVQSALAVHWADVYSKKFGDMEKAADLLNVYNRQQGHLFTFSSMTFPDEQDYSNRIGKVKDSAAGPDGIPYSAYRADKTLSGGVLYKAARDLSREDPKSNLLELNKQLVWFAPKGASDPSELAVYRTPDKLRTIFGSNSDIKLIAGTSAEKLVPGMLALTPGAQRGFCRGRQLSLNIVDLDSFSRAFNQIFRGSFPDLGDDIEGLESLAGSIPDLPVTPLYDFCNAFPTLLHDWMFYVLHCLGLPLLFMNLIQSLYTNITAYSAGVGDGSFLFEVLGGVKTGCPLSSILFILCINPFVHLCVYLSDNPGLSVTRVCADDFGSALRCLKALRTQASIFKVAAEVAGLHLKPSKCVIVVSCLQLTQVLEELIRDWLVLHVPAFAKFKIQSSGKYLGWFLGVNSVHLSFQAPLSKFVNRVEEVCIGQAPAAVAICTYNQRAVTVLSYVAQFSPPPVDTKLEGLSQWAVHKILRLPANCMSRELSLSSSFCSAINPLPLKSYCLACLYRFADSEREYLYQLRDQIRVLVGDETPVSLINSLQIPDGGVDGPPILNSLIDALELKGPWEAARVVSQRCQEHAWLLEYPACEFPSSKYKGIQTAVLSVISVSERCKDVAASVATKTCVTFGQIYFQEGWFSELNTVFLELPLYIRMCWFKTICGGWVTSVRTGSSCRWGCLFGCGESPDSVQHYLVCPILWAFARETMKIQEDSILINSRLCINNPTVGKLKLLAFAFSFYNSVRKDPGCRNESGEPLQSHIVQNRGIGLARAVKSFVSDC